MTKCIYSTRDGIRQRKTPLLTVMLRREGLGAVVGFTALRGLELYHLTRT
jgi:hypothetical protein